MRYFFILGRTPELSLLEIYTLAHSEGFLLSDLVVMPHTLICTISPKLPITSFMARLGGTIKIGVLLQENPISLKKEEVFFLLTTILKNHPVEKGKRTIFGFSAYTVHQKIKKEKATASLLFSLGLSLKKILKEQGAACRLVPCQDNQLFLSSVSVQKNHLLPPYGIEIVFLEKDDLFFLGRTLVVQPFEEYSDRDWNRPHKNMQIGLLPPKLAQIMINLSGCSPRKRHTILDPFCGFGTILQEAFLMGFSSVYGSDSNPHTLLSAQENLAWIAEKKNISLPYECVRIANATYLSRSFPVSFADAIITESYLGPSIHRGSSIPEKTIHELSLLYTSFLKEASLVLKKNGIIVIALPVWLQKNSTIFLPIKESFSSLGFVNMTLLRDYISSIQKTQQGTILYSRTGQSVGREILILKKAR